MSSPGGACRFKAIPGSCASHGAEAGKEAEEAEASHDQRLKRRELSSWLVSSKELMLRFRVAKQTLLGLFDLPLKHQTAKQAATSFTPTACKPSGKNKQVTY